MDERSKSRITMSKRAEEYANAQYTQRWVNRTPTSSEKVDYNEHARWAAIIAYEQAEKDTIERACDMLMNYVFEEVTPEMRDHFRKRLEEE